jgi:hypothetical protein
VGEREELRLVEKLVAHTPVETLDETILGRPARLDVMPVDLDRCRPADCRIRGELVPVVGDDCRRPIGRLGADDREVQMASTTYYVALAFTRSEGGATVACEPKEAGSSNQTIRLAESLATAEGHCGAIAFSRTRNSALGDFADAVILKTVGQVDSGLLTE